MASIAGSIAGAVVSKALSGSGGKKSSKSAFKPFTPSNIFTPSGSATWNNGVGTATLTPEVNNIRNDYVGNTGKYQSQIDSFFGPNKNDFYHGSTTAGTSGFNPLSYEDWAKTQSSAPANYGTPTDTGFGMTYFGSRAIRNTELNKPTSLSDSPASRASYQQYLSSHPATQGTAGSQGTFDQAGYDAARANYKDPASVYYDQLTALSQPYEDKARADNESRLFSQGLLGASNGQGDNPGIKSFEDSVNQARGQRALDSKNYVADMIAKYQNLQNSATQGVQSFDKNPLDLLTLGSQIGTGSASNGIQGQRAMSDINNSRGNFWGAAAGSIGGAVSRGVNGLFSGNSSVPMSTNTYTYPGYQPANKYYSG